MAPRRCSCAEEYLCSSCGRCYQHEHSSFCLLGVQWYWRHPVRVVDFRSPWREKLRTVLVGGQLRRGPVVFDASMALQEPGVVYW